MLPTRALTLLFSLVLLGSLAHPAAAQDDPAALAAGCQWLSSAGGAGQFTNLYNDPDATLLNNLRFGDPFVETGDIARDGYLDFDGNGRQDLFRVVSRPDGFLQWQYSPNSAGAWVNLAYAGIPLEDLRFGDFNSDSKTDVFAAIPQPNGARHWSFSSRGVANFALLRSISAAEHALYGIPRLGDFNGDGKTDLFVASPRTDGAWQWRYAPSGSGALVDLAYATILPADLRFGDFNGDRKTDVFAAIPQPGGARHWSFSAGGVASFSLLKSVSAISATLYGHPRLGDFNGDGKTDLFVTEPRTDGAWQWKYAPGGSAEFVNLAYSTVLPNDLRLGQFNQDGFKTDVFAAPGCSQVRFLLPLVMQ